MGSGVRLCVLSDTHGHLNKEVVEFCQGADQILHAGDVCSDSILPVLESIAPVACVSGNMDVSGMAPMRAKIVIAGWRIMMQHIVWHRGGPSNELQMLLNEEAMDLVVFGHTHEPLCRKIDNTVFFNPGSCGPRRFSLPRTVGEVILDGYGGWFRISALAHINNAPPILESRFQRPQYSHES